ncbi:unnamed protein product [Ascophyllum nodosum]
MEGSDSDDNVMLSDLSRKTATKAKPKSKTAPQARAKVTPAKSPAAKKLVTKKGTSQAKKSAPAKKKAPAKGKRKAKSDQDSGDKLVTRSGVLYDTAKGELVQKLLCRWWYAMEWPAQKDLRPAPPCYEALEGYPGIFICVEGDDIGKLLDVRNKSTCPCFTNFAKKTSEELKKLLEVALTKQKEALVAHWGMGVAEEANINRELKWLRSVDPAKADRAAVKALAHAKINN